MVTKYQLQSQYDRACCRAVLVTRNSENIGTFSVSVNIFPIEWFFDNSKLIKLQSPMPEIENRIVEISRVFIMLQYQRLEAKSPIEFTASCSLSLS